MLKKELTVDTEEREKILKKISDTAQYYEEEYGSCARNVLAAIQENLEICDEKEFRSVFQAADALAGGVAHHQQMCGAALGGVLAIGLVYGSDTMEPALPQGAQKKSKGIDRHKESVERGHEFVIRFKNEFGSTVCREVQHRLTGRYWDLRNPEDRALFITKTYHDKCGIATGKAARLAAEVILESSERYL